jgi:hypothetical protein
VTAQVAAEVTRARDEFCQAIRGYSEDLWCAQWMRGVVDTVRKEGGIWLMHAARSLGWPIGLDGEDGWEPLTAEEREAFVAYALGLIDEMAADQ